MEFKRVQTLADISADQTRSLLARKDQKDKEIEQYQMTLGQLDKQTDDKLTIGRNFYCSTLQIIHSNH